MRLPPPKTTNSIPTSLRLPRGRAYDPWQHAETLGVQVIERRLLTANELWMPEFNTVAIKVGMRAVHKRVALAHGLAHAQLGHEDDRPKFEHQADRYASLYLIDPDEFRAVAGWTDDVGKIADELGVTLRVLAAHLEGRPLAG
jgi:Zn-dependent peptidase ImmA (M78 family)